jgi:hypothetical protein
MTAPAICERCGLGLIAGADSALRNATVKRDGFRPIVVKVHKREYICSAVLKQRGELAKKHAMWQQKQSVWWRRALRALRIRG